VRKIFWFGMQTLDGYHETVDGELFWHNVDAEFHAFTVAQLDEADTLIFGRKTYEHMARFWPGTDIPEISATAERMNRYPKVVVSATLTDAAWGPVTVLGADYATRLAELKEKPGKDIILIGSSELAAGLLDAGLLDELRVMINPVVIGGGHASLAGARRAGLKLTAVRQFGSGNVLLTYQRPA
jgi:dihydrofolate reductase